MDCWQKGIRGSINNHKHPDSIKLNGDFDRIDAIVYYIEKSKDLQFPKTHNISDIMRLSSERMMGYGEKESTYTKLLQRISEKNAGRLGITQAELAERAGCIIGYYQKC